MASAEPISAAYIQRGDSAITRDIRVARPIEQRLQLGQVIFADGGIELIRGFLGCWAKVAAAIVAGGIKFRMAG
jgi:hypothetical protein